MSLINQQVYLLVHMVVTREEREREKERERERDIERDIYIYIKMVRERKYIEVFLFK